jgi:phage-related tail protein
MLEQLKATQQHMADLIGGVKESLEREIRQLENKVDQSANRVERAIKRH